MASKHVEVVDAVVTYLDAGSYTLAPTFSKSLLDLAEREDLPQVAAPKVTVIAGEQLWERMNRSTIQKREYTVTVAVRYKSDELDATIDSGVELCEEIKQRLAGINQAGCVQAEITMPELYSAASLVDSGIFRASIDILYREVR